jgi:hypothetical protein
MRTKTLHKAKLVIRVESDRINNIIRTLSVFDNRTQREWTREQIVERGIEEFMNVQHLKETLNWNLNGDESKYQFKWGQSSKTRSEGLAYVFN